MALVDWINQANTTLRALVPAVNGGSVAPMIGMGARKAQNAPPLVVWVPTTDEYEIGGEQHSGTSKTAVRVVASRVAGVDIHIWGAVTAGSSEDYSATDLLIGQVVAALKANFPARNLVMRGGRWVDENDGRDFAALGRDYVLSVGFRMPLTALASTESTAPITSAPQTNQTGPFPSGTTYTNP